MYLLDYIYIASFGGSLTLLTHQFINFTPITIIVGIIATITCYKVTKEEYREGNE